jgi:hypothetical protein
MATASAQRTNSSMLATVIANPTQFAKVSTLPTSSGGAFCAVSVESWGESPAAVAPHSRSQLRKSGSGASSISGLASAQAPLIASWVAATRALPKRCTNMPPTTQPTRPAAIAQKAAPLTWLPASLVASRGYLGTLDEAAWVQPARRYRSSSPGRIRPHNGRRSQRTCLLFFAYADNYLIDLKAAIIVDVEATRAIRQAEVGAARTMIERTEDCLGLCPERLAADSAYGSAEMLGWLVNERAIEPHIPVFGKSARDDGTFSRGDFADNEEADIYVCPAGKALTSTGTLVNDGATLLYRASKYDCDTCELKSRCCPKMPAYKVHVQFTSTPETSRAISPRLKPT